MVTDPMAHHTKPESIMNLGIRIEYLIHLKNINSQITQSTFFSHLWVCKRKLSTKNSLPNKIPNYN